MRKGLLLVLACLMTIGFAGNVFADTRLDGMSADSRAVEDMDLIWLYPNKALQYKNTVDVRLTDSDTGYFSTWNGDYTEWGGILKDAGDFGVLGIYTGRPQVENWNGGYWDTYTNGYWQQYTANSWLDWSGNNLTGYNGGWGYSMLYSAWTPVGGVNWQAFLGAPFDINPHSKADAFWAKSFSDMDLGVRLSYADNQRYVQNDSQDSRTLGVHVGLGVANLNLFGLGQFNEANFHIGYEMGSFYLGQFGVQDNGIYTISAGALLVSNLGGDDTLRLYGDANLDQFSLKGNATAQNNDLVTLLGAALNHKVGNGFINSSLSFVYGGQDWKATTVGVENDYSWWDVIWNVSIETPLSGWLTYRAGLSKPVFVREFNRTGLGNAATYGDLSQNGWSALNMGLTANVENLTIDALMNVAALENFLGNPNLNQILYDNSSNTDSGPGPLSLVEVDLKAKI